MRATTRRVVMAATVLTGVVIAVPEASVADDLHTKKLRDPDGQAEDRLGSSLAIGDGLVVAGALGDATPAPDAGSVMVFELDDNGQWAATKLTDPAGTAHRFLGSSVAVGDGRIVAGSPEDNTADAYQAGSILVFEPDGAGGWVATKLTNPDPGVADHFGRSVAVAGNRIIVGTPNDKHPDFPGRRGSITVFEPDGSGGWTPTVLFDPDGAQSDLFGWSVAAAGVRILVGARTDDTPQGVDTGSVTVFEPDGLGGWLAIKLIDPDAAPGDGFAEAIAVDDDRIVVGTPFDETAAGLRAGSVTVFEPDEVGGWSATRLTDADGAAGDLFGFSVAAAGGRLLVGAPHDDSATNLDAGSMTLFEPDPAGGWTTTKLVEPIDGPDDELGYAVAVRPGLVAAGIPRDNLGNGKADAGSVLLFPGR